MSGAAMDIQAWTEIWEKKKHAYTSVIMKLMRVVEYLVNHDT